MLWLIDILISLKGMLVILFIVSGSVMLCISLFALADEDIFDYKNLIKLLKYSTITYIMSTILYICIPDKSTLYIMLAERYITKERTIEYKNLENRILNTLKGK